MVHLTTSLWVKYYKYSLNWLKMFKGSMVLRISTRKSKRSTYGPPPPSGDNEENSPRTSQFPANPQEAFIPLTLSKHPKASLKAQRSNTWGGQGAATNGSFYLHTPHLRGLGATGGGVATETGRPREPEIFTIWPFKEKPPTPEHSSSGFKSRSAIQ